MARARPTIDLDFASSVLGVGLTDTSGRFDRRSIILPGVSPITFGSGGIVPPQPIYNMGWGSWINNNQLWDVIRGAQDADVQPNQSSTPTASDLIYFFGLCPFSGATAEHPGYGWRHSHRFFSADGIISSSLSASAGSPAQVNHNMRAALMNNMLRRIAYLHTSEVFRYDSYSFQGRPFCDALGPLGEPFTAWAPELPGDTVDVLMAPSYPGFPIGNPPGGVANADYGKTAPNGLSFGTVEAWTGPDLQHNWDMLWELVVKGSGQMMPTGLGASIPTLQISKLAAYRLWYWAECSAAQIRHPYELNWLDKLKVAGTADRAWGNYLHVLLMAAVVGCTNILSSYLGTTDIDTAALKFLDAAIEFYLHQPGVAIENLGYPGQEFILPVQLSWALVPMYMWYTTLKAIDPSGTHVSGGVVNSTRFAKLEICMPRMAQWVTDCALASDAPNTGHTPWRVFFTPQSLYPGGIGGPVGGIPATLVGFPGILKPYDSENPQITWDYRGLKVAAKLGIAGAAAKCTTIENAVSVSTPNPANLTNFNDPRQWKWLVGADGKYVNPTAAALAGETVSSG